MSFSQLKMVHNISLQSCRQKEEDGSQYLRLVLVLPCFPLSLLFLDIPAVIGSSRVAPAPPLNSPVSSDSVVPASSTSDPAATFSSSDPAIEVPAEKGGESDSSGTYFTARGE